jgi:hypothetical protein
MPQQSADSKSQNPEYIKRKSYSDGYITAVKLYARYMEDGKSENEARELCIDYQLKHQTKWIISFKKGYINGYGDFYQFLVRGRPFTRALAFSRGFHEKFIHDWVEERSLEVDIPAPSIHWDNGKFCVTFTDEANERNDLPLILYGIIGLNNPEDS